MSKKKSELMLANDHASVALASVVYDPGEDDLLVAAFAVAASVELLVAIKAQLEKNGRNPLNVVDMAGGDTLHLRGAGSGYVTVKSSLRRVNARGLAVAFLHRAAADPALVPGDWFYVVATADQVGVVPDLFVQRLTSATYHTILPEWKDYLLAAGLKRKLVTRLPIAGGKDDFAHALRVERCPEGWQDIISAGLRDHAITF